MRTVQPKPTSFRFFNIYKGWFRVFRAFYEPPSYLDHLDRNLTLPCTILSLPSPLPSIYEDFGALKKKKMFLVLRSSKQVLSPP